MISVGTSAPEAPPRVLDSADSVKTGREGVGEWGDGGKGAQAGGRKLVWCLFKLRHAARTRLTWLTRGTPLEQFIKPTCICFGWSLSGTGASAPRFTLAVLRHA